MLEGGRGSVYGSLLRCDLVLYLNVYLFLVLEASGGLFRRCGTIWHRTTTTGFHWCVTNNIEYNPLQLGPNTNS